MAFTLVPLVHVDDGRLVDPDGTVRSEPPQETILDLGKKHDQVYIVDYQGLRRNRPDVVFLQDAGRRTTLWVDAGARFASDVMDMYIAGADRVTMRWAHLKGRDAAIEAAAVAERVDLALEFDADGFVKNRDDPAPLEEVLRIAATERLGIVVIDHERKGTMAGLRRDPAFQVRHYPGEKWFAGGIASKNDLDALEGMGFTGALVSKAVLEGRLP